MKWVIEELMVERCQNRFDLFYRILHQPNVDDR
jgi:hypothetical protein